MQDILSMWLNPINLGFVFLCLCAGVWLLAHCAPHINEK